MMSRFPRRIVPVLTLLWAAGAAAQPHRPSDTPRLCAAAVYAIDAAAERTMATGAPGALVEVAQDGQTLFTARYGSADLEQGSPMPREAVFPLASITKMFTAAAILSLEEEGRLSLDVSARTILPELPPAAIDVRIYDLLVQTSGIPDYSADPDLFNSRAIARTQAEMVAIIASRSAQLNFQPGSAWEYSNSNYVLLGEIIERVTGQPVEEVFAERLFAPAGLADTLFDDPDDVVPGRTQGYRRDAAQPSGFANSAWISPTLPGAAGGLRGTSGDLVVWSSALFDGRILQLDSLQRMVSPGVLGDGRTTRSGMPQAWQAGLQSDYAMGLFVRPDTPGGPRFAHSGDIDGFTTWFAYYPESRVTIVQMINSQSTDLPVEAVEAAVFGAGERPCREAS